MFHHWRKRASTCSDSAPATTSSASARSCSTSTSPEPLVTSRSSICSASANERSGASPVAIRDWAMSPFE